MWLYFAAGEGFTRWAVLLFYGTVCGIFLGILGLVIVLAIVMAARI